MGRNNQDSGFEDYRRERNKRRLNSAPRRDLGANARVLKELEQAEMAEARNQQLTREVHDFFTEATRTAAEIVQKVSLEQIHQVEDQLSSEMADFLAETIRRAQEFVSLIQVTMNPDIAETEVIANMQNLVGRSLDEFRSAGTAQLADKHLGLDPFALELDLAKQEEQKAPTPEEEPEDEQLLDLAAIEPLVDTVPELAPGPDATETEPEPESKMEDHLVATAEPEPPAPTPAIDESWFLRLKGDPDKLKTSLKVLVRSGMMSKDEALAIYRKTMSQ